MSFHIPLKYDKYAKLTQDQPVPAATTGTSATEVLVAAAAAAAAAASALAATVKENQLQKRYE